jgi:hypothetical protein
MTAPNTAANAAQFIELTVNRITLADPTGNAVHPDAAAIQCAILRELQMIRKLLAQFVGGAVIAHDVVSDGITSGGDVPLT